MNTQHTPGPWHRNIRANGKYPVVFAGRNQHVATTSQQTDPAETEANIDLISAAPELLEALQAVLAMPDYDGTAETSIVRRNAKTAAHVAIAKATGGAA